MNTSQPPRAARFLLERLAPPNESLVGDLAEAYREGRSDLWYWRQAVGAIVTAGIREVQAHPVAVIRSLLIGWMAVWVLGFYSGNFAVSLDQWLFERGVRWFYMHGYGLRPAAWVIWVIGAFSHAFGGTLAVRYYHGHRRLMAVVYAGTVLCVDIPLFGRWIYHTVMTPPPYYGEVVYAPIAVVTIALVVMPAAALLGGLWAAGTKSSRGGRLRA
jgi:hypothetical protein